MALWNANGAVECKWRCGMQMALWNANGAVECKWRCGMQMALWNANSKTNGGAYGSEQTVLQMVVQNSVVVQMVQMMTQIALLGAHGGAHGGTNGVANGGKKGGANGGANGGVGVHMLVQIRFVWGAKIDVPAAPILSRSAATLCTKTRRPKEDAGPRSLMEERLISTSCSPVKRWCSNGRANSPNRWPTSQSTHSVVLHDLTDLYSSRPAQRRMLG
jgi:hypothetical protein